MKPTFRLAAWVLGCVAASVALRLGGMFTLVVVIDGGEFMSGAGPGFRTLAAGAGFPLYLGSWPIVPALLFITSADLDLFKLPAYVLSAAGWAVLGLLLFGLSEFRRRRRRTLSPWTALLLFLPAAILVVGLAPLPYSFAASKPARLCVGLAFYIPILAAAASLVVAVVRRARAIPPTA